MIRNIREDDYDTIILKINEWWGGRDMVKMLPRLFFIHFQGSSFAVEDLGRIVGFLIGFISDTHKDIGYIHFVGVDPTYRNQKIATKLYKKFIDYCVGNGVLNIKCVTSPTNKVSIAFHYSFGFKASSCNINGEPLPINDCDGPGGDRVLLKLQLHT